MSELQDERVRRAALVALEIFAVGVAIAVAVIGAVTWAPSPRDLANYAPNAVVAIIAGAFFAWTLGTWTGRRWASGKRFVSAAIATAWLTLIAATFFGSLASVMNGDHEPIAEWCHDYLFKPMFWFTFVGTAPAVALGLVYAAVLARRSTRS